MVEKNAEEVELPDYLDKDAEEPVTEEDANTELMDLI